MVTTTEEVRAYALSAHLDFDNWYAEEIRKAKEQAWADGYRACNSLRSGFDNDAMFNPYRKD